MLYIVAAKLFINQTSTVFEIGTPFHGLYICMPKSSANLLVPAFPYGLVWLYECFRINGVLNEL